MSKCKCKKTWRTKSLRWHVIYEPSKCCKIMFDREISEWCYLLVGVLRLCQLQKLLDPLRCTNDVTTQGADQLFDRCGTRTRVAHLRTHPFFRPIRTNCRVPRSYPRFCQSDFGRAMMDRNPGPLWSFECQWANSSTELRLSHQPIEHRFPRENSRENHRDCSFWKKTNSLSMGILDLFFFLRWSARWRQRAILSLRLFPARILLLPN